MVKLYPHQKAALDATEEQNKVAYYLDMGLGKTFVGSEKMLQLNARINLVVCQKSKVEDWVEHFCKCYTEYQFEFVIDGTKKASLDFFIRGNYKSAVCVINYDLIFRRPELEQLKDFTLMLDESSLIQNEMSKRSKFILKRLHPENVILLSGTPTGGKYEKLWSQCHLLGWNITKGAYWNTFVKYHFDDKNGFPLKIVDGYKNVDRLKSKLREHGAIFMKSDEVFDLPQQIFTSIKVNTSTEYRKFKKTSIIKYNGRDLVGDTTLTKMLYLRMLCNNKDKIQAFKDLLNSTEDRLIVFYNFVSELSALLEAVEDRPISIVNGETKDLEAYEKSENSVIFIQYTAGAMGLNLQKANKIVYYAPPLSSEIFEQSKKRTHRIGQEKTCYYYKLICRGSIEEKIYRTLEMRKNYTERLFEEDENC